MADGWSIKRLIRRLVLTPGLPARRPRTTPRNHEVDPDNALVWRTANRRLDAEAIRDAMLAVGRQARCGPAGRVAGGGGRRRTVGRDAAVRPADRPAQRPVGLPAGRARPSSPTRWPLFDFAEPSLVTGERATTSVPARRCT